MKLFSSVPSPWIVQGPVHEFYRQVHPFIFTSSKEVSCTLSKDTSKQWHHKMLWQSLLFLTAPIRRVFYMFHLSHNFAEVGTFHRDISSIRLKPIEFNGIPILALQNPSFSDFQVVPYKHRLQAQNPQIVIVGTKKYLLAKFWVQSEKGKPAMSALCVSLIEYDNPLEEMSTVYLARNFNFITTEEVSYMFCEDKTQDLYFLHNAKPKIVTYNVDSSKLMVQDIHFLNVMPEEKWECQTNWTMCPDSPNTFFSIFYEKISKRFFVGTFLANDKIIRMGRMPLQLSRRVESVKSLALLNLDCVLLACDIVNDASMVFQVPWTIFLENM